MGKSTGQRESKEREIFIERKRGSSKSNPENRGEREGQQEEGRSHTCTVMVIDQQRVPEIDQGREPAIDQRKSQILEIDQRGT